MVVVTPEGQEELDHQKSSITSHSSNWFQVLKTFT